MRSESTCSWITATFRTRSEAEAAATTIAESGVPRTTIDLQHGVLPEAREANFLWRIVVVIVLWSIVGAVPGAAFGWFLAETIGPGGTEVMIMYVVCMMILGHLVAGMVAGYVLLADRTSQEMPPNRPVSRLTITGVNERDVRTMKEILRSRGATDVAARPENTQHV
jgi:hypothetical protein